MMVRPRSLLLTALVAASPTWVRAQTAAATNASGTLSEVVVTAQKRTSTVQNTPVSITAVTGADLQTRGITNFTNLAQSTPGVSLKSEGPGQTEIELRGMTSSGGNSATVGFYLNDVPMTAPAGAQNGKVVIDPTLYDLSRVEILRGPQGTLYGSGSMGGTVKLITNPPDLAGYHASGESILSGTVGGGFNHNDDVMVNLPLVDDKLALRLVGTEAYTSGWIKRIVSDNLPLPSTNGAVRGDVADAPVSKSYPGSNAEQAYSARASLLWRPTPRLSITPSIFYQTSKQDGISAYDSNPGTEAHYQPFDIAEPLTDKITVLSLDIDYSFDTFDMTSSTSQWRRTATQIEDGSEDFNNPNTGATYASNYGLPNPGYYGPTGSGEVYGKEVDPSRQFSEELRFASKTGGPLTWVAGAYYSDYASTWTFNGTSANPSSYMDLGTFAPATTPNWFDAKSPTTMIQYAIFGDATYALTEKLKANVGVRWYDYSYRFDSVISGWGSALGAATPSDSGLIKISQNGFDPKFNLSYTFSRELMAYATVSKGSRPGGGNAQYPTTGAYWSAVYAPYRFSGDKWPSSYKGDSVWSYEIGQKAKVFDRRVTLDASLYYEDWSNIQLEALPGDWALNINGDHANIFGGEIETNAILGAGFDLAVSASYTDAVVDPGPHWQITPVHKLSDVAPVTGNVVLSYSRTLTPKYQLKASVENGYTGRRYSLAFPYGYSLNGTYIELPDYDLTNIRVGIHSADGWGASLFVNNLFNKHAQLESLFQETLPSASFNRIVTNQPLTAGIDLTYRL
jgi:outer membrane receptor protein involved in Fe transport